MDENQCIIKEFQLFTEKMADIFWRNLCQVCNVIFISILL